MRIRHEHGLAYVEASLVFRGRALQVADVILDTGSAGTIFSADRLLEIGIAPDLFDPLRRIRGVGGTEFVFTKKIEHLAAGDLVVSDFEVEVGAMDYGFPADGILGLDFLIRAGALIDLRHFDLR
jgi:hypothetical protein